MEQVQITNDCSKKKNNTLNYLIDQTFTNLNRLFVLSFAGTVLGEKRDPFSRYYLPNVEIKDFNVLIDRKVSLTFQ